MTSLPSAPDQVGDLLRAFYHRYGVPGEGPPAHVNVTVLMGGGFVPQIELEVLRLAVVDVRLQRQFDECGRIIEDLADRLTSEEFLREVSGFHWKSADRFEHSLTVSSRSLSQARLISATLMASPRCHLRFRG